MKNVYFLSGAHLGFHAIEHGRTQERRLVNFLDNIKHKASAVYLLGDMFNFWYEFRLAVPKGYTHSLGKLSEPMDIGVEVHFFTGNRDIWCGDYLSKEYEVIARHGALTTEVYGKEFYLVHGDGLGGPDKKLKLLHWMFHNTALQALSSVVRSHWSMELGLAQARHSREKRVDGEEPNYVGENKRHLVPYTKEYLESHPNINFFVYGHRHIELDLMLDITSRVLILGNWINYFSCAVFDGEDLFLEEYIGREAQA